MRRRRPTSATQNVNEGATVTGTLDFVQGADGASVTHIGGIGAGVQSCGRELLAADRHRRRLAQGEGGRLIQLHGGQSGDSERLCVGDVDGDGRRRRHGDGDGELPGQ